MPVAINLDIIQVCVGLISLPVCIVEASIIVLHNVDYVTFLLQGTAQTVMEATLQTTGSVQYF